MKLRHLTDMVTKGQNNNNTPTDESGVSIHGRPSNDSTRVEETHPYTAVIVT